MAAGQLKKMEKIWKGQDKQTKLKIFRAFIFPTAIYIWVRRMDLDNSR